MNRSEHMVLGLLETADVQVGGSRPQDITVHDPAVYRRVLLSGDLGVGESYMDGQWDANQLDVFIEHVLRARISDHLRFNRHSVAALLSAYFCNMQDQRRSKRVADEHYDKKSILPEPLLDPYNQYTCAYFNGTNDLNKAQEQKLDLICRKLQLERDDQVLDIGCGWGGFAKFAAERYGCHVTGISISEEQIKYAREFCKDLPVAIRNCDYRNLVGTYNKILTCGMIEHVGYKNYRKFFQIVHDHLADGGLYLLHTIGGNESVTAATPFFDKYIFPGGMLPSISQIDTAREGLFTLQDMQNLGFHYSPTLKAWHGNMQSNWQQLSQVYDERFRRMFEYYLLSCKGAFDAGNFQLWQLVFSKLGDVRDYRGSR